MTNKQTLKESILSELQKLMFFTTDLRHREDLKLKITEIDNMEAIV